LWRQASRLQILELWPRWRPLQQFELALRKLEAFARAGLAGFFTFLHPRIASKQAFAFQSASQIAIGLKECPRDGKTRRAGLAGNAAAAGINEKIVSVNHLRRLQWLKNYVLQRDAWEIIFEIAAVDVDLAAPRSHPNARNGSFSTTGGDEFLCLSHKNELGELDRLRLLRAVRMGFSAVNFELSINRAAEPVVRNHSADRTLD